MKRLLLLALLLATAFSMPPPKTWRQECKTGGEPVTVGSDDVEKLDDIILAAIPAEVKTALLQEHIKMRNHAYVLKKVARMIAGGAEKLGVISDFDHTMSRAVDEQGEHCWATHEVFQYATEMPKMVAKMRALKDHYYPIEYDPSISDEEKIPQMEAWWNQSHEAIVAERINKSTFEKLVLNSNIRLRDDADSLIAHLEASHIPLVIFSAGIGDVISIFFAQRLGAVPANMHLVGNMMIYDENNVISGFREPLIHTFNKNGKVINKEQQPEFFAEMRKRNNVLLMGDSMGDTHMDVGVCEHYEEGTLKIGFLNKKKELLGKYLPKYLNDYDIVIINDQSMDVTRLIIDAITKTRK